MAQIEMSSASAVLDPVLFKQEAEELEKAELICAHPEDLETFIRQPRPTVARRCQ